MHAITGAYAKPIFVDQLGANADSISNGIPLEDFGNGHPNPNLTHAKELVTIMYSVDQLAGQLDFMWNNMSQMFLNMKWMHKQH